MGIYVSEFEREFTYRTLILLDELDKGNHEFEATLLINLCVGLITIPNEYSKRKDRAFEFESFLTNKYNGTKVKDVLAKQVVGKGFIKDGEIVYRDILDAPYVLYLRKLRNALSHGRIELLGEAKTIDSVRLRDVNGSNIKLNIEELKTISKAIANVHMNFFDYVSSNDYSVNYN